MQVNSGSTAVHPRVCGEQKLAEDALALDNGSSPRVRGTADHDGGGYVRKRFIPACAGNSVATDTRHQRITVHPRVCGEQIPGRENEI